MKVNGNHYRTVWLHPEDDTVVQIIDQTRLPFEFNILNMNTIDQAAFAISEMQVRGAGCIGATAGYGMYLAALHAPKNNRDGFLSAVQQAGEMIKNTRPTAINLAWAANRVFSAISGGEDIEDMISLAKQAAEAIADEDASFCRAIGQHGLPLILDISKRKEGQPVNILTHCNAGWLAFVDYGSATASIYAAHDAGIPVHVWVDETRPRNQGARLTAWELAEHGVAHTVIVDNAGGHLMQHGMVDLVITGSDRTTLAGDVANKIGTYLKALAAHDNGIPFYVALPSSSIDWEIRDGIMNIPIEERNSDEVRYLSGLYRDQEVLVLLTPAKSPAGNPAFDITPRRLVTGLITERGICDASEEGVRSLFPER